MTAFVNSSHFIQQYQNQGDPLAEAVVEHLRKLKIGLMNPISEMRRLAQEGDKICQEFLADADQVPEWVDFEHMHLGARMAARNLVPYMATMLLGTLVQTYIYPPSAAVFSLTGRLGGDTERRLFESADLFLGILKEDGLRPGNETWEMCVKIRLLHTMVRLRLKDNPKWTFDEMPVSMKETAVASWAFGTSAIENMKKLGAVMTAEEEDGFYMIWRYVCRLEGADAPGCHATAEEQKHFEDMVINQMNFDSEAYHRKRAADPSAEPDPTEILMEDLLTTLDTTKTSLHIPRPLAEAVLRLFHEEGAEYALKLHRKNYFAQAGVKVAATALRGFGQIATRVPLVGSQVGRLGLALGTRIIEGGQKGVKPDYQDVGGTTKSSAKSAA